MLWVGMGPISSGAQPWEPGASVVDELLCRGSAHHFPELAGISVPV